MLPPRSNRARCLRAAMAATGIVVVALLAACGPAATSSTSSAPLPHTTTAARPSATGSSAGMTPSAGVPPTRTNCIRSPHLCGYPDETNTGWAHTGVRLTTDGVTLTAEREFNIDTPGAVVDGKDIRGCVNIKADNVTIRRSRIRCDSYFPVRVYEGHFTNAVLEDDEIDGMNATDGNAAVGFDYLTLRRLDIHSVVDGPHMGDDVLVEDSYVHDLIGCEICPTTSSPREHATLWCGTTHWSTTPAERTRWS